MTAEIHLSKKDFVIEWYSGSGAGGQHRNKHQNCCRIIHQETGLSANGTGSRERSANQRSAFSVLASRIISRYSEGKARRNTSKVIRNYHAVRNEVHDKASGLRLPYKQVVDGADISAMIEARAKSRAQIV